MTEQDMVEKWDAIHADVTSIKTCLLGVENSSDDGLVGKVNRLDDEVGKLKRSFWMLIAFLVGSGVISGGIVAALR